MSIDYDNDLEGDDLVAQLRKQLKEKDKSLKEQGERLAHLEKATRQQVLAQMLPSAKLAKFFPADVEATEDNVKSWLTENADVFGIKDEAAPPADEQETPPVPDAYGRLAHIQAPQGDQGGDAALLHQITTATDEASLLAMIHAAGGGGL